MIRREGPKGTFYGCLRYPVCKGYRVVDEAASEEVPVAIPVQRSMTDDFTAEPAPVATRVEAAPAQEPSFSLEMPSDSTIKETAEKKFKVVSDPTRLKLILILSQKQRNVTELCDDLAEGRKASTGSLATI